MKKKQFLKLFRLAWNSAFTIENIQKVFAKPSIWPYNPALILKVICCLVTPPEAIQPIPLLIQRLKTPRSTKSIRRFQADFRKKPS